MYQWQNGQAETLCAVLPSYPKINNGLPVLPKCCQNAWLTSMPHVGGSKSSSWRAINVLPAYGSVLHGFGGYLLFFYPKPPSVNSSAFLLWGTYPASDYELVTSAEAVLFPCNILLLQATELGGTRFKSGQSESSPRIVYKLDFFFKKKVFFCCCSEAWILTKLRSYWWPLPHCWAAMRKLNVKCRGKGD